MNTAKWREQLGQLILTDLRELVRDKMNFFFVLIFPFLFLFLFLFLSLANGKQTFNLGLVVPQNPDARVQALVNTLEHTPDIEITFGTEAYHRQQLELGLESVVLVLPQRLDRTAQLRILSTAEGQAESATLRAIILQALSPSTGPTVTAEVVGAQSFDPLRYSLPGILIMAFASLGLFGLATPLILQRQRGTLRLLGLTPLSPITYVLAQIISRLAIALAQLVFILGISYFILGGIPLAKLPGIFLSAFLGIVMLFALGYVLGVVIPTPEAAGGILGGLLAPVLMLTGILLPFNILPPVVLTIARFIPLTYLGDALRQQLLGNPPIASLTFDNLVLLGSSILLILLAARLFRWSQPESGQSRVNRNTRRQLATA
jgi:ABC-2 type transport system permease protein